MRGISLEEISESTKIGTRSLRALEEDDYDLLPGGIFNKGFVRAYSRFLGLNEEQTVADFEEAFKQYQLAQAPPPVLEPEEPEKKRTGFSWALVVLLVLILAAVGWIVGHRRTTGTATGDQAVPPESTTAAPVTPVSAPVTLSQSSSHDGPQVAKASDHRTTTAHRASVSEVAGATVGAESTSDSVASSPKEIAAQDHPAAIRLQVFAREDSWMSILADGKSLGQGILSAQKTRNIRADKEVKLRLGNVGGVEISFNGKPVDIDGQPQQVKELTFTAQGLQQ